MGKNSKSLPDAPTYQQDPMFREALGNLSTNAQNMATLNLSSNPKLMETIQFHPEMLDTFLNTLKTKMTPEYNDSVTSTTNELANLGALESSTTADSLGRLRENFQNTLQVQTGQFGLESMMKALENRVNIAGMGLQGLGSASQIGGQAEANLNNFNLANYENQVAQQVYQDQNKSGGFLGALQGGLGGGLAGFAVGGPVGAGVGMLAGGAMGALGPQSTGNSLMQMGGASVGSMKGLSGGLGSPSINPVSKTATNSAFSDPYLLGGLNKTGSNWFRQ